MESFKKALKQAIVDKADGVRFDEGQAPSLMLFANERTLSQLGILDKSSLQTLISSLIPNAFTTGDSLFEGTLNITNFGEIKLLAVMQDVLRLFALQKLQFLELRFIVFMVVRSRKSNDCFVS